MSRFEYSASLLVNAGEEPVGSAADAAVQAPGRARPNMRNGWSDPRRGCGRCAACARG